MADRTLRVEVIGDASSLQAALGSSSKAAQGFAGSMKKVGAEMTATGRKMTRNITLPVVAIGAASIKMAGDFETSMSRVVGLAGQSEKQVAAWSKQLLTLGPKLGKGPRELADALYFVASSGVPAAKVLDAVTVSAKASTAGMGDTEVVADAVTSAMNAYASSGLSAAEATDVLVATVREGKGEAAEFAPVIGNVAAFASRLGVSFDEVGGALAGMTQLGTDAATASTQLQAFFSQLLKPTKEAERAAKDVGLSFDDLRKTLMEKGLPAALDMVKAGLKGNEDQMGKIFPNVRALRAVLALAGDDGGKVAGIFERLGEATGSLDKAFAAAQKREGFKFEKMKAAAEAAAIAMGTVLLPTVSKIAEWLAKAAIWFSNLDEGTKKWIATAGAVAAVAGPILMIFGSLAGALATLVPILAAVASPIGLLVVAIAALTAGIAAAVLYPDQFATALQKMGVSAEDSRAVVKGLADTFKVVAAVVREVAPVITTILGNLFRVISDMVALVSALLRGEWGAAWKAAKQLVVDEIRGVLSNLTAVVGLIARVLAPLAQAIARPFVAGFNAVKATLTQAVISIRNAAVRIGEAVIEGIGDGLTGIADKVASGMQRVWNVLTTAASTAYNFAKQIGSQIVSGIWDGFKGLIGGLKDKIAGGIKGAITGIDIPGFSPLKQAAAEAIGKPIMEGAADGVEKNKQTLEQKTAAAVAGALKATQGLAAAAARLLGGGQVQEIINGIIGRQPSLTAQITRALREAMDTAKLEAAAKAKEIAAAIATAKDAWASVFGQLAQAGLDAIDAKFAGWVPPALKVLDEAEHRRMMDGLITAANDAKAAYIAAGEAAGKAIEEGFRLSGVIDQINKGVAPGALTGISEEEKKAIEGMSPEQVKKFFDDKYAAQKTAIDEAQKGITDALKAQNDAEYAIWAEGQREKAIAQTKAHNKEIADEKTQFGKRLKAILTGGGDILVGLKKLWAEHNLDFFDAGKLWGDFLAEGLKKSKGAVRDAAQEVAQVVKDNLTPRGSPAKDGPLSKVDMVDAGRTFGEEFGEGLSEAVGPVTKAAQSVADAVVEHVGGLAAGHERTGAAFVEAIKGPITEGIGDKGRFTGRSDKTRGAMGKEGTMAKAITEDEIQGDKPAWADQEIWGLLGRMTVAEGKWTELLNAVQSGSFKSNAGLLDQLFRRRTRWNWDDPMWSPRMRRMFELMSGDEGWSGRQVADYFGLMARGGIVKKDGYAYLHANEAVVPLPKGGMSGVNVTVNVAGYVGNERQLAQQLAPAFMEAMRRQQGSGSALVTRVR